MLKVFFRGFDLASILLIIAAVTDLVNYILLVQLQEKISVFALLIFTVLLTTFLKFFQNRKSIIELKQFRKALPNLCQVIRDNQLVQIEVVKLVPGDIVELSEGITVPADLRMIISRNLKIDKSLYTGDQEPQQVHIEADNTLQFQDQSNCALFGTICRSGSGRGIVLLTGIDTYIGQMNLIENQKDLLQSNLRQDLMKFQIVIVILTTISAIIFLIIALYSPQITATSLLTGITQFIVAIIPEGLFASLSISLSMANRRLAQKNILVCNNETIEKLSDISCLFLPFQGQFTQNRYSVYSVRYNNNDYEANQFLFKYTSVHNNKVFQELYQCCVLTSNLSYQINKIQQSDQKIDLSNDILSSTEEVSILSDATERGLMKFFQEYQDPKKYSEESEYALSDSGMEIRIPFNSVRKYSLSVINNRNSRFYVIYIKGAPETIWQLCTSQLTINGEQKIKLSDTLEFNEYLKQICSQGKRVIGFAYAYLPYSEQYNENYRFKQSLDGYDLPINNLCFLGTVALNCFLRSDATDYIQKSNLAEVKIVIFTGEDINTVRALAKQCKFDDNSIFVEGSELYLNYNEDDNAITNMSTVQNKIIQSCKKPQPVFFCRIQPQQRALIVKVCSELGYKVAITMEKIQDIDSYKYASISVTSQALSTQQCINLSDVTISGSQESFLSIFSAIFEARRAVQNLGKTFVFQMTSNTAKMMAVLLFYTMSISIPLNVSQMLAIAILTDKVVAIGFSREQSEEQFITKKVGNHKKVLSPMRFIQGILILGVVESAAMMFTYWSVMYYYGFEWNSLIGTNFSYTFKTPNNSFYNESSWYLGNTYLQNNNNCNIAQANLYSYQSLTKHDYQNGHDENIQIFQWGNYTESPKKINMDLRQIFVKCTNQNCNHICNPNITDECVCWQPSFHYTQCQAENDEEKQYCYQAGASFKASTAVFIILVICQCGLILSIATIFFIEFVPGVKLVFSSKSLPFIIGGITGFPFAMSLLIIEECRKHFFPDYQKFRIKK